MKSIIVAMLATHTLLSTLAVASQTRLLKDRPESEAPLVRRRRLDFSQGEIDEDSGLLCVIKRRENGVNMLQKDPLTECVEKNVQQCHHTYVTQFRPQEEEVCEETFEKVCQISFNKRPFNESLRTCMRSVEQRCDAPVTRHALDGGCSTIYKSKCATKHVEREPGRFVADTSCENVPEIVCADKGCRLHQGDEICRDELVASVLSVPQEQCDLNPQRNCRKETRLVPALKPVEECHQRPKQVCRVRHQQAKKVSRPTFVKICLRNGAKKIKNDHFKANIAKNNLEEQRQLEHLEQHPLFQPEIDYTSPPINFGAQDNLDDFGNFDANPPPPIVFRAGPPYPQKAIPVYNKDNVYRRNIEIEDRNDKNTHKNDASANSGPKHFQSSFRFVPPELFSFDRPEHKWHEQLNDNDINDDDVDDDLFVEDDDDLVSDENALETETKYSHETSS